MKIVNKIRFININFGPLLFRFLQDVSDVFYFPGPKEKKRDVTSTKAFRGQLSKQYVDL